MAEQASGEPINCGPPTCSYSDINSNKPSSDKSRASLKNDRKDNSVRQRGKPTSYFKNRREYHVREDHFDPEILNKFESASTYPCHTSVYKSWLKTNAPYKSNGESWLFIGIIAVLMGIISFVIKQTVDSLYIFQYEIVRRCLMQGDFKYLWLYYSGFSICFSVISSVIVVYICPSTAGSGMPELMAILNGVVIRKMLSVKVLFWKIISSVMSILSTLPVGFEGPMIHIGSMVPTILTANYKCWTKPNPKSRYENDQNSGWKICRCFARLGICVKSDLCRLRDGHEKQVLACVGAASGFAAALNAPMTGLCFSMEEMSSNWSNSRTWQTLFCTIFACAVHRVLKNLFSEKKYSAFFIEFPSEEIHIFNIKERVVAWMSILVPALFLGIAGGLIASTFIAMHLKIMRLKTSLEKRLKLRASKVFRILDVFLISVIFTSTVMLILMFLNRSCRQYTFGNSEKSSMEFVNLNCGKYQNGMITHVVNTSGGQTEVEYHEVATLFLNTWEQLIRNLFTRGTQGVFSPVTLTVVLAMIFAFSSLAASASLSGGLMISQLAIGALYGRIFGEIIYHAAKLYGRELIPLDAVDPGLFSLLGSASFFAGASRLPITTVVMMVEMTNDTNYIFAIMITVLTAKYVADCLTQSLYHSLMELKSMPYLDSELKIYWDNKRLNLEIFEVGDVMASPVQCVEILTSVRQLAEIITTTKHGAFPVVKVSADLPLSLLGVVSRMEIVILLCNLDMDGAVPDSNGRTRVHIEQLHKMYSWYSRHPKMMKNMEGVHKIMNVYLDDAQFENVLIDLSPYLDTSTVRIPQTFSLERTYNLFRQMGLRHLVVVDRCSQVVGIITRKDLLEFVVEKRLHSLISESIRVESTFSIPWVDQAASEEVEMSNGNLVSFQDEDQGASQV